MLLVNYNELISPHVLCQDGRWFLQLVQSVEERINALCLQAEADMNCTVPEEGRLRFMCSADVPDCGQKW